MHFLADESCDFAVVRALRQAGHDVLAVSEVSPRIEDTKVIELSLSEGRILLTEDKDFGRLVYASGQNPPGVIFFRFPSNARKELPTAAVEGVSRFGKQLDGSFVVMTPGRLRIGRLPGT